MRDSAQAKDVKNAILDATDKLLGQFGYKKMTIDDLAKEAGIGKGSVYLHFSSKEEVALSHIDRIIERLKGRLAAIAAENAPASKRIREMLLERVLFRFDSVQHYTKSLNELLATIRPKLLERRKRYFEEEARAFAAVVRDGVKSGEFAKCDPLETAQAMLTATNSLLPFSLSVKELGERHEIEQKTTTIAEMLLNGIRKK